MKKQGTTDAKRAAANDKPENGKAAKRSKPAEDAKYVIGNTSRVKRGFLLALVEFAKAKGEVHHVMLVKEFLGVSSKIERSILRGSLGTFLIADRMAS
jgi:hypothetical protein